jgi:succinyl-CoA synthetase alpha subunit
MTILFNKDTLFLVQGITGREGSHYTARMLSYGTPIVAGVTPEKGGEWQHGLPVFDSVHDAVEATGANASIVFVQPAAAVDALYEAVDARLSPIVCVTEGIPINDALRLNVYIRHHFPGMRLLGPGSPGILVPGRAVVGITPLSFGISGKVGIVARSASLAYDVMARMTDIGIGISAFVGLGGDPVSGTTFTDILALFEDDIDTGIVILIGEIGGTSEHQAAAYIRDEMTKPVIAYIAGAAAPQGVRMGHAGARITSQETTAIAKLDALSFAGARVVRSLDAILPRLLETLGGY